MAINIMTTAGVGAATGGFQRDLTEFLCNRVDRLEVQEFMRGSEDYRRLRHKVEYGIRDLIGGQDAEDLDGQLALLISHVTLLAYKEGHRDGVRTIIHSLAG